MKNQESLNSWQSFTVVHHRLVPDVPDLISLAMFGLVGGLSDFFRSQSSSASISA